MQVFKCRFCNENKMSVKLTIGPLPINIWPSKENTYEDGEVYLCEKCGHIQLQSMSDEFIASLYEGYNFIQESISVKNTRYKHIKDFVLNNGEIDSAIDVGGGVNSIFSVFNNEQLDQTSIDFSVDVKTSELVDNVIEANFTDHNFKNQKFDLVMSFHCLEHVNYTRAAFYKICSLVNEDGYLVLEVPDIEQVIENIPYYGVFHQHINLYTRKFFVSAFNSLGMELIKEDKMTNAMFFIFKKSYNKKPFESVVDHSKEIIAKLSLCLEAGKRNIEKKISGYSNKTVALYGAGGSNALFLANFPIVEAQVKYCFDRDEAKSGLFIGKSRIPVYLPDKIKDFSVDCLLFIHKSIYDQVSTELDIECIDLSNSFEVASE